MKPHLDALSHGAQTPHILFQNHLKKQQPFIQRCVFPSTKNIQKYPNICQLFHGSPRRDHLWNIHLGHLLLKKIHKQHFLLFLGTTDQFQYLKDFMNNLQSAVNFIFEYCTQQISFLDMKIHIGANGKPSTTLRRKPTNYAALLHFQSNHSLKRKESIIFLKALRYNLPIADDTTLQKGFDSLTIFLIARQYHLHTISRNIPKALLDQSWTSNPNSHLSIITPYFVEGK